MAKLTDLRTNLVRGAFRVMQSPRFVRFLQDKRVLSVLVDGMSLRARVDALLREAGSSVARAFGLATLNDLRALEHDLRDRRRLEAFDERPRGSEPSVPRRPPDDESPGARHITC